ncbi:related to alpha/beta hydrolase [Phialocephala subalpina]|uniref:Related to alpha/beta hydrolase n=1 Tax=Phialocephala subalpina TaxID=576137 RepID=A0A1L7X011_9HELO|nr:related to alpha/beta hydrolase [Phialocephala subalpina]
MYEFFKSHEFFNFEITRILGTAPFGGCEIGEFLDAVGEIKRDNPESWHRAWYKQGEKAEKIARDALAAGHSPIARNAFLRASNYFRASQYMFFDRPSAKDSRVLPLLERSIENFQQATKLMDGEVKLLEIEYQGYKLPGYLYLPPTSKRFPGKIPLVVLSCGADSTQEEMYYSLPVAGADLGYAVLTFEGPGQGIVLRRDKIFQRPDWEVVISAVLDHLEIYSTSHPEIELDMNRIATTGLSLGGYYALRGASDPRIKACVAGDAFYDMWDLVTSRMPPGFIKGWTSGWIPDWLVDWMTRFQGRFSFQSHWEVSCSSWIMGTERPVDLLKRMREFTFRLPDGELSAGKIMKKLGHIEEVKKEVWIPNDPGEGGLQAKVGAWGLLHEKTFRFLDQHFEIRREAIAKK